jgi:hypothetical protein
MVRVQSQAGEWLGFVDVSLLKDRLLEEGATWVLATIESVEGARFSARLPGHPVRALLFEGSTERAVPVGPVEA